MKILFIAPLPPPINGQSLAAKTFLEKLIENNDVEVVNMVKKRPQNIFDRVNRNFEVVKILKEVFNKKTNVDSIYLTISESFAGNIKDLFIYLICYKKLRNTFIHMLGGAGMKSILDKNGIQYKINKYFVSQMRGVIVEGKSQATIFSKLINRDRIHIVPNFAEDYLFISEKEVREKFSNMSPLKILFLSNLIFGKGHNELVDAYLSLNQEIREKVNIVFVGGFETDDHKNAFLKKIKNHTEIIYYGNFVSGEKKKALYRESHIFCLPTYYPYEGQPISILEAYATGCVVITTKHSGIPDIFDDKINGFAVEKKSINTIKSVIEKIVTNNERLLDIAILNRNIAYEKYRTSIYSASLMKIINKCN